MKKPIGQFQVMIWGALGLSQGFYLIGQNANVFVLSVGVLLCAVASLIVFDAVRIHSLAPRVSRLFDFFGAQKRRISALYAIYKMAPELAAARESFLLSQSQTPATETLPPLNQIATERLQVWREVSQAEASGRQKAVQEASRRIQFVTYAEPNLKNLKMGLLTSDVYGQIEDESTLIMTDIGSSEVGSKQLKDFVANKISLSFWIAKKTIANCDLLVIQRDTFLQESDILPRALEMLAREYKKVLVFVHSEVEQSIKSSFMPPSEHVIQTQTILE